MKKEKTRRVAGRPFRWMLVFLVALALAVFALLAVFNLQPERFTDPPSAPKPPMHNAPR